MLGDALYALLGAVFGLPVALAQNRVTTWHNKHDFKLAVRQAVDLTMFDLEDPTRHNLDLRLPCGVVPQRVPWTDGLTQLFSDTDLIGRLADQFSEASPGTTLNAEWAKLVNHVTAAVSMAEHEREKAAEVATLIILLFGKNLSSDIFGPAVARSAAAARDRSLVGDVVQRVVERVADIHEIDSYLAALVGYLETDLTQRLAIGVEASALNRRLTVSQQVGDGVASIDADRVLDNFDRVLITGEPGSGKSWLAQRLAILAARRCREQLANGADVGTLRLPVFARLREIESSTDLWQCVVQSTAYGWQDHQRAKRLLTDRSQPLLVALDSYDESAGSNQILTHLSTLDREERCKLIVTSRPDTVPEAVRRLFEPTPDGSNRRGVAVIEPMEPAEIRQLMSEVARVVGITDLDSRLTSMSGVGTLSVAGNPLLSVLTVLALAEPSGTPVRCVPDLYELAIRRLLRREAELGREHQTNIPSPDLHLERWMRSAAKLAWGAQTQVAPSNRFQLDDTIDINRFLDACADAGFRHGEHRFAEAVLTKHSGEYQFLHRTIHEHLVARHAATLLEGPLRDQIVDCLVGWSPWNEIAPSVILLLDIGSQAHVADKASHFVVDWCVGTAPETGVHLADERMRLLRELASCSTPGIWVGEARESISRALSTWTSPDVRRSRTWGPNHPAIPAIAGLIGSTSNSRYVGELAQALVAIGGDSQRAAAAAALTTWLESNSESDHVEAGVRALTAIVSDSERSSVVAALKRWLETHSNSVHLDSVARALVDIGGESERDVAAAALHHWFWYDPDPAYASEMARAMVEVGGEPTRSDALNAMMTVLSYYSEDDYHDQLARAIVDIAGDTQRSRAAEALTEWLFENLGGWRCIAVASALGDIVGDAERDAIVSDLLSHLINAPDDADKVAWALASLARASHRQVAVAALSGWLAENRTSRHAEDVEDALAEIRGTDRTL